MTDLLTAKRIRLKVDCSSTDEIKDVRSAATPHVWLGNDVRFELGIFWGEDLQDISNISELTIKITDYDDRETELCSKTINFTDMDSTLDDDTWDDASKQHALVEFTGEQFNPSIAAADHKEQYWVGIMVVTTDGKRQTIGCTKLIIEDDGVGEAGTPPVNDPLYYTAAQSDARYKQLSGDNNEMMFAWLWNADQGRFLKVVCKGPVGSAFLEIEQ